MKDAENRTHATKNKTTNTENKTLNTENRTHTKIQEMEIDCSKAGSQNNNQKRNTDGLEEVAKLKEELEERLGQGAEYQRQLACREGGWRPAAGYGGYHHLQGQGGGQGEGAGRPEGRE